MRRLTVQVLGPFTVTIDGTPVTGFGYAKVRALLAYLAVEHRAHPRAQLALLLWPDQTEQAARASLSQALTTLRNALGDRGAARPLLLADLHSVQLDPAGEIDVDVTRFRSLLGAADAHVHHSWRTCQSCADRLRRALDSYCGSFLADVSIADSDLFEEWAALQRANLLQRTLTVLERLVEWAEWRGAYQEALGYARRLVAFEPLFDVHQRAYMRTLALNGAPTAALAQYGQFHAMLDQELAAEPEDATTALADQIRRGDMQGLQTAQPPFVVPVPPTPIVSRADELQAVCARLRAGAAVRAVTITGTGGIGKTRLALEAAHALRYDFEDGVFFVELAMLREATLVADAVARALGVKERPGLSTSAAVRDYVRGKHLLLILDNFEHVVTAASLVSDLLAACPALTVLVTSRAPLNIRAEYQFALEPLTDTDAVELFMKRAHAAGAVLALDQASTAVYAAVCRRLDRLPLAIELIAVHARSLAPHELLHQLERPLQALVHGPRDVPARHQALRNAIQWSYGLLDPDEQHVFVSLGVFAGGWSAEAAQAVLGESIAILPVLERLQHASLIQRRPVADETRFVMLETIRAFALEQLKTQSELPQDNATCETDHKSDKSVQHLAQATRTQGTVLRAHFPCVQRRHAEYFLALLEQAVPEQSGSHHAPWTQRLKTELPNLRVALQTVIEAQDGLSALRLVALLRHYWSDQGSLNEGREWIDRALVLADATGDAAMSTAHHEALLGAAFMAFVQDEYARAQQRYEQLLALARRSGQHGYTAKALDGLGVLAQSIGHLSDARDLLEQSITASRAVGDAPVEHRTLFNLAFVYAQQGVYEAARAHFERAVAFYRSGPTVVGLGTVQAFYAYALAQQGDYDDARPLAEEALAISIREDLPWMQQIALNTLGLLAFQHHAYAAARELFERARAQSQRLGDRLYIATALSFLGLIDVREQACDSAYERLVEALELARAIRSPKAITLVCEGLADLWVNRAEYERATQLFGAIEVAYLRRGARPAPLIYELQLANVQAAHVNLGAHDFALAWAKGQELSLEAACVLAVAPSNERGAWNEGQTLIQNQAIGRPLLPSAAADGAGATTVLDAAAY